MLLYFAVSFALGIACEQIFRLGWSVASFVLMISIASFLLVQKESKRIASWFLVVGLMFSFGILRMSFVNNSPDPKLLGVVGEQISFEATIKDEPDVRDSSVRYTIEPAITSESQVMLVADPFPLYEYGDKIKISGKLELPKNFSNDNGSEFDYISYLAKDKIHFLIYRPKIEKIDSGGGNRVVASLYSLKHLLIDKIGNAVPEPNASLLGGLIFGAKQSLGQELLDDFRKVGLIHIVVLSGYNITIIAVGIFYLTSFLGRRKLGFIISAISITLFAIMVGLGATVIRACIMALIAILARYLGRPNDALRALFVAGFMMIFWNPLILFFDPSFQLSFMATLGLILFSPFIYSFISTHKIGKFISEKFGLREIVSSTLAVQFFVLPILIRMSGFASIISFVVNPIILPTVPWAMLSGALTGVSGSIPLFGSILSWPFGIVSYLITEFIVKIVEFSSPLPLSTIQTGALPLSVIFLWYLAYAILLWKLKKL